MVLLREELGDVLRSARRARGSTLRDISARASVSLGYLSEIERGEKEASSELVASICQALDLPMSVVFTEIAHRADRAERASAPVALPVATRDETVVSAA
ncbi:helix-turn-helix transcriptional regulator [Janibacter sp. DB-40]|uniref:helix-turn-helix domain-containing protein n=1 Tax=Janibacter sp. DB-40 TaxID=3028808 RepID=UPI0024070DE0|nr:helix-turn-helix transcriptional regulator [Janibacter sp. DB-40]